MTRILQAQRAAKAARFDEQRLTSKDVLLAFSLAFDVDLKDLKGSSRRQPLVLWRHSAYFGVRLWTTLSYPGIARVFNGRDHTSAMHGVSEAAKRLFADVEPIASLLESKGVLRKYQKEKNLILEPFEKAAWALEKKRGQDFSLSEISVKLGQLASQGLILFEEDSKCSHKKSTIVARVKSGAMLVR